MNILAWHVHGSWMTAFVQGRHTYHVPVLPDRGPDGRGRALTWDWPTSVVEVTPEEMADLDIDAVILQRPHELGLAERWLRRPLSGMPVIYVEHDTPLALPPEHPMADRGDVVLVHVTPFNALMWAAGTTRVRVIEHGVVDPGQRWTGEVEAAVAAINEPVRRRWVAGTDLLEAIGERVRIDLFGMRSEPIGGHDVPQHRLHEEMARRRVYLHPFRWTSLGLSLVEAMHLGMPVVALAATEVLRILPSDAGVIASDADGLATGVRRFLLDLDDARRTGERARAVALDRFGLARFLADWDALLADVVR